jgi:trehalose 6-phosphate phosphatase
MAKGLKMRKFELAQESSIRKAVDACLAVIRSEPAGLITDIDGTISEIALTPGDARVEDSARAALRKLTSQLALVAIVTGRSATAGSEIVGIEGLTYIGNHGMERVKGTTRWDHPIARASSDALIAALAEVAGELDALGMSEGLIFENKRLSGSIHYRLSPYPEAVRAALLDATGRAVQDRELVLTEGRLIVELRPNVLINKGTAIRDLVNEFGLRSVVFFGDDLTDVDGFRVIRLMREAGEVRGIRVGVLATETQPAVLAEVDVTVEGVKACVQVMEAIADALDAVDSSGATTVTPGNL